MTSGQKYRQAVAHANASKQRLVSNFHDTKARISPARLKQDVYAGARDAARKTGQTAKDTARRHPFVLGAIVASVAAYVLRRPLITLIVRYRASAGAAAPTDSSTPIPPANPEIDHEE